ncbi:uncharacterized protein [Rutidosis leptorrhynchoides]|uniref:uncharacterized protein n=1 Tax=Rutidosis leptorrhynchoides TaxID=125765 RepID=UPI003A9951EC
MKILSVNIRGFNRDGKVGWFKRLLHDSSPIVTVAQETKRRKFSDQWIEYVWGSQNVRYAFKECRGRSGGLLILWDSNIFNVDSAVEREFFIAIKGKLSNYDSEIIIVNVYGPHSDEKKKRFWDSLNDLMSFDNAAWVLCGDFNEVRYAHERENSNFIARRASWFNNFIHDNGLIEIPLSGRKFTQISDDGIRFSKLDHHTPLLLKNGLLDFGPKPTRIFDSWIDAAGASQIISEAWNLPISKCRPDTAFRIKLKNVKMKLKEWSKTSFGRIDAEIKELSEKCLLWELDAEQGSITDADRSEWLIARSNWIEKERDK